MSSREPSMEDILASIKRVIAEEKEIRAAAPPPSPPGMRADDFDGDHDAEDQDDDVLELDSSMAAPVDEAPYVPPPELGPPLVEATVADSSRARLDELAAVAATAPPPPPSFQQAGNPLEDMLREMLRPVLKQWLDENLPKIVDEHVKREIHRITGR